MPSIDSKNRVASQAVGQPDEVDQAVETADIVAKTKAAEVVSVPHAQKKKTGTIPLSLIHI